MPGELVPLDFVECHHCGEQRRYHTEYDTGVSLFRVCTDDPERVGTPEPDEVFLPADEPYIDIAPSPNARLMVFDAGWADEIGFGERVSVDGVTRLRIRASSIAYWAHKTGRTP